MGLDVAIALVLPKPRANVYSFPDNVCNLNNLPISDEIAVVNMAPLAQNLFFPG
jgi:hypothetical protein